MKKIITVIALCLALTTAAPTATATDWLERAQEKIEHSTQDGWRTVKARWSKFKKWLLTETTRERMVPEFKVLRNGTEPSKVYVVIDPLGWSTKIYLEDSRGNRLEYVEFEPGKSVKGYRLIKVVGKKPIKTGFYQYGTEYNPLPSDNYYVVAHLTLEDGSEVVRPVAVSFEVFKKLKNSEPGTLFEPFVP